MKTHSFSKYLLMSLLISFGISVLIHFPSFSDSFDFDQRNSFGRMGVLNFYSELLITAFVSFILLIVNYFILEPYRHPDKNKIVRLLVSVAVTSLLVLVLSRLLFSFRGDILFNDNPHHHSHYLLQELIIASAVIIYIYFVKLNFARHIVELENEKLVAESLQNQYTALKNQVSPHFLFNSLTALQTLTRENPELANEYINKLSSVLRYTLQSNENKLVTLDEELKFLDSYIFLIQMRYGSNLKVEKDITEDCYKYMMPPLTLQILIENAVKHNEISTKYPLSIRIISTTHQSLIVSNSLKEKLVRENGTGIGLSNISKLYRFLSKKEISIKKDNEIFMVEVPLLNQ